MLYEVSSMKKISSIPHKDKFNVFMRKITPIDYQKIIDTINNKIDMDKSKGSDIQTAGWIPGHNWAGTVYEPILTACDGFEDLAGKIFGIIVWKIFMDRPDHWGFGRYSIKDVPIESMTYFGITPQ